MLTSAHTRFDFLVDEFPKLEYASGAPARFWSLITPRSNTFWLSPCRPYVCQTPPHLIAICIFLILDIYVMAKAGINLKFCKKTQAVHVSPRIWEMRIKLLKGGAA